MVLKNVVPGGDTLMNLGLQKAREFYKYIGKGSGIASSMLNISRLVYDYRLICRSLRRDTVSEITCPFA